MPCLAATNVRSCEGGFRNVTNTESRFEKFLMAYLAGTMLLLITGLWVVIIIGVITLIVDLT